MVKANHIIRHEVLNPLGFMPDVQLISLAQRPRSLNNKVIYIIYSWPVGSGSQLDDLLAKIGDRLTKRFSKAKIVAKTKPSAYGTDDPKFWDEIVKKADAFIYGAAPSCATTMYAVKYTGLLEKRGRPGVPIIFDNLIEDAKITCAEIGMRVRWVAVPYPPEKISDKQMPKLLNQIIESLTSPLSEEETRTGITKPPKPTKIACKGTFEEINRYFYDKGLTDGLPVIPCTKEGVAEMLKGTSHPPDEVVTTTMWPAQWQATVEKVAIVGVMAGCIPKYMAVLLAATEAFSKCGLAVRSTNSFSYMQVINGPIRKEIDMNAGTYALGPGNRANATIGRFLSLAVTNLGGGQVGVNLMGTQGNVSGYTFCFPENEEDSPWESFAVENGYEADESTLSMFATGWSHCGNYLGGSVDDLARAMAQFTFPSGMVVLVAPPRAKEWAKNGYSKKDFKDYIWSHATLPMKIFRQDSYYKKFVEPILRGKMFENYHWPENYLWMSDDAVVPVYPREGVQVVVVGADQNPMMQGWKTSHPTIVSIDKWR
ncbi:MAG: hypothetical protein ABSB22_08980 [Thermodesulfobacteriota bacterium]|jgi:hypothetical protein